MTDTIQAPPSKGGGDATTHALLARILDRLDHLEARIDAVSEVARQAQAAVTDTVDEGVRRLEARGIDVDARARAAAPLLERLTAPETLERIGGLVERLDAAEQALDAARQAPAAIGALTDVADDWIRAAQEAGIDVDARLRALGALAVRLSDPEVTHALETLVRELPRIAPAVEAMPRTIAAAVDVFDDFVRRQSEAGVDVEALLTNTVTVATQVSNILHSPEFVALMESGVLAPRTLDVIGQAGRALAETQSRQVPQVGLLGALSKARQPDVQRLLGFALTFAESFGRHLDHRPGRPALAAEN